MRAGAEEGTWGVVYTSGGGSAGSGRNSVIKILHRMKTWYGGIVGGPVPILEVCAREMGFEGGG